MVLIYYKTHGKKKGSEYLRDFLRVAPLSHAIWRSVEALAFSTVKLKKPSLDVGCGFGEFAGVVFDQIEIGIDINEDDLRKATIGKKYNNVVWCDARKTPFDDNSFENVVSVSVLEHIKNPQKVLEEIFRILRKNGTFAFTVPTTSLKDSLLIVKLLNGIGFKNLANLYFNYHCWVFKHHSIYPKVWWEDQLKKNNFKILDSFGTISPALAKIHEMGLPTALLSQICKIVFGKRMVVNYSLRNKLFLSIFKNVIKLDKNCDINVFFLCKK